MRWFFGFLLAAGFTLPSQLKFQANGTGSVPIKLATALGTAVSVRSFGAVCDNTTDDSAAIQAAINAAGSVNAVWIDPGCKGTYTNASFVTIFDLRSGANATGFSWNGGAIITDRNLSTTLSIPNDMSAAWPTRGMALTAELTGANGANKNLLFRNTLTASTTQFINFANTAVLLELDEVTGGGLVHLANPTNTPLTLDASGTDAGRISGGGTNPGLLFYPNISGTGTSGAFRFRNNATDNIDTVIVDTTTNKLKVWQRVEPIAPAPQAPSSYPLGNDLWLNANGAADLRMRAWSLNLTSTTSVGAPGSVAVTTGSSSTLCPSSATADPNCSTLTGSTANLCTPAGACSLLVEPDGANEETITSANWSVTNSTSLTATFAKTHTQPYTIRQIGSIDLDGRQLRINQADVTNHPLSLIDRLDSVIFKMTNDTAGTFPTSGLQFNAILTGLNGANKDLIFRASTSSSAFKFLNSANTGTLFQLSESANGGYATFGNATNNPLKLDGTGTDLGRIYGGGTGPGLRFHGTQGGTGTSGIVDFVDNATDANILFRFTGTGISGSLARGFKHQRGVAGCTTAAAAGAVCSTTFTWTNAFPDANYTFGCTGIGVGAGTPVLSATTSRIAASIAINTMAVTAAASSFTTIDCWAFHD